MATVRAAPLFFRVHVFGERGSAEVLGEGELLLHGARRESRTFPPVDALRAELDAFAAEVEDGAPLAIPLRDIMATVNGFEAVVRAVDDRPAG